MKKYRILLLVLCAALLFSSLCGVCHAEGTEGEVQSAREAQSAQFHVDCKAAMLIDLNNGRTIYEQNADDKIYPASLTKIMTCLVALERGNLSDTVTVSETALDNLGEDSSLAGLQVGEQMSLENLLYCMMIVSGNEACNVVAEHIAGSVSDFVRMMNERAYELGCRNTHFANPHGLHHEEHYTTARDLSIITQAALKSENFKQITNTAEYELPATNLSEARTLSTTNMLISKSVSNIFYYPKAAGIKTGYTSAAGRCVISTAKSGGMYFLGIVCGAATTLLESGDLRMESFPECIKLFEYGFNNFQYVPVLSPLYPVTQIGVENSAGSDAVALSPRDDIQLLLPNDYNPDDLVVENHLKSSSVQAPVHTGDILGSSTVLFQGQVMAETELLAIADVARSEIANVTAATENVIHNNWWKWVVAVVILLILLPFVLLLVRSIRQKRRRKLRMQKRRAQLERRMREQDEDWR